MGNLHLCAVFNLQVKEKFQALFDYTWLYWSSYDYAIFQGISTLRPWTSAGPWPDAVRAPQEGMSGNCSPHGLPQTAVAISSAHPSGRQCHPISRTGGGRSCRSELRAPPAPLLGGHCWPDRWAEEPGEDTLNVNILCPAGRCSKQGRQRLALREERNGGGRLQGYCNVKVGCDVKEVL